MLETVYRKVQLRAYRDDSFRNLERNINEPVIDGIQYERFT